MLPGLRTIVAKFRLFSHLWKAAFVPDINYYCLKTPDAADFGSYIGTSKQTLVVGLVP